VTTVTDAIGQPVDLTFAPGGQAAYVVDLAYDQVHRLTLATGVVTTVLYGLTNPFGMGLAPDGVSAFIVTEPAAPSFPPGDLLAANLATGSWSILARDVISGATSIVVNPAGTRAYVTQFGIETDCTGKLSRVDLVSPTYLSVTDILTGLCGPHDLDVRADERQFYVVLVGSRQLIRVDLVHVVYLPLVLRGR
jgi:DNA-binding beta-propeller fold protein YncE